MLRPRGPRRDRRNRKYRNLKGIALLDMDTSAAPLAVNATDIEATIESALRAPYRYELLQNEDGTWFARVAEFSGCMTEGDTAEDAISNLRDAMREWLQTQLEDGEPIPTPAAALTYSGKFMLRVPPRLHRDAAECAAREGISLNAFASTALARAVGESAPRFAVARVQMATAGVEAVAAFAQGALVTSGPNVNENFAYALSQLTSGVFGGLGGPLSIARP